MATIYVVEDDNDILEIETFALKNSNYEVKGFTNAKDFYAAVEQYLMLCCLMKMDCRSYRN